MRFSAPIAFGIIAFLAWHVVSHAWISDDAYITFRVVDNIVHGLGAVWNPDERVQVYTHPLWMLLHVPFYALFGHIYLTTIGISLVCFATAAIVAMRQLGRPFPESAFAFLLPLSLSLPVIDYATSGLENPLSMLLIACFAALLKKETSGGEKYHWLALSFTSALLILNRMDLCLMIAPAWAWLLIRRRFRINWLQAITGALPLIFWFAFSLFYYGFLFPNTKYAKLHTGISEREMLVQGLHYLQELDLRDMLSFFLLLGTILISLYTALRSLFRPMTSQHYRRIALGLGIGLYTLYVIAIGGDFMGGRFWSVPLFLGVILLAEILPASLLRPPKLWLWLVVLPLLTLGADRFHEHMKNKLCSEIGLNPNPTDDDKKVCSLQGVLDERRFYIDKTSLFTASPIRTEATGLWVDKGLGWRAHPPANPQLEIVIGMQGYYAGPRTVFIDEFGLADPLLARLPIKAGIWRIGHFKRDIPQGYAEARKTGDIDSMDPALGKYYLKLQDIVSGDLWSLERLKTIWEFNRGAYENWRQDYINRHCPEFYGNCQK